MENLNRLANNNKPEHANQPHNYDREVEEIPRVSENILMQEIEEEKDENESS